MHFQSTNLKKAKKDVFSSPFTNVSIRLGAMCVGVFATLGQLQGQSDVSLIQQEINRRSANVEQAKALLKSGDAAYKASDFKLAVENYSKAFSLVPEAGVTRQLKQEAGQRYAQAAVEYGKVLSRTGQYDIARGHLNDVLKDDVAPGNAGALKMLAKLDDPVRYNTSLEVEHVRNIEKVAHWLRKAESFYLLGKYDEALIAYEEVIRIDPYNKASRRGMEKVAAAVSDYARSANDQYRSNALADVDALWERKVVPANLMIPKFGNILESSGGDGFTNVQGVLRGKLSKIIVPRAEFDDVPFKEAIRVIRRWARELDTTELDPAKRGMNFVNRLGDDASGFKVKIEKSRVNLNLSNVPLSVVLDYVTQQTGTYWRQDPYSVVIRPRGAYTAEMELRTFRVPVGFLDSLKEEPQGKDVFDDAPVFQGKATVVDTLKKAGITFGKGANAFYNKTNNTLRVTNTPLELDAIDDFIRARVMDEKIMVVIKTSVIETSNTSLTELGYDHLIDPTLIKNNVFATGGTQGSGSPVFPLQNSVGGTPTIGSPLTSGLRSGNQMFSGDNIDSRIAGITTNDPTRSAAPLQVTGQINGATFQTILRALSQKKDTSVMHQSTAITIAGQRSYVYSGNDITYATEYEPGEVANGGGLPTPSTPTGFETKRLGFKMEVEPTVSEDRQTIDLNVNPEIITLDGFVNYSSPLQTISIDPITGATVPLVYSGNLNLHPVFKVLKVNTNVTIQDGHTMVIGGLVQSRIDKVSDKVPVLGDLPLVGRFFQTEGLRNVKKAVVVFVKVELVDPTGEPWRNR